MTSDSSSLPWSSMNAGPVVAPSSETATTPTEASVTGNSGGAGGATVVEFPGAVRDVPSLAPRRREAVGERPAPARDAEDAPAATYLRRRLLFFDCWAVGLSWIGLGYLVATTTPPLFRLGIGVVTALTTLLTMRLGGLYRPPLDERRPDEWARVLISVGIGVAVCVVATHWRYGGVGTAPYVCGAVCVLALVAFRRHYHQWLQDRRAHGFFLRKVIIVGASDDATQLRKTLSSEPALGYRVTAMVGVDRRHDVGEGIPHLADIESIPQVARSTGSQGVLLVPNGMGGAGMRRAIDLAAASGLDVQIWPGFEGVGSRRLRPHPLSGEVFFAVKPFAVRPWQRVAKRGLDLVGALFGLIVTAPLLGLAAVVVKCEDRGPVFHRQERVGKDGVVFVVTKLRTMVVDAESVPTFDRATLNERTDGPLFKSSRDPRITRVGRFLRATSIDELPQLWNVLTGSMSLVGPRPALPEETAEFDETLLRRLTVTPGLTGLWQVEGRDNPSFNAYRRLDLYYIDNWSLFLDVAILLSTPVIVVSRACLALRQGRD